MQYQARTGPIANDAAAITVDMLQGCLPTQKSHATVSRQGLCVVPDSAVAAFASESVIGCLPDRPRLSKAARSFSFFVPDVALFPSESVIGYHPDAPRLPKNARGASFFPWSGTTPPVSPDMIAGNLPDRPRRITRRFPSTFVVPDIDPFAIDSIFAMRPERPRLMLGPRIGQPLSQPTHTSAPISVEMLQGSTPPTKRYIAPRHDGWQVWNPTIDAFSIEMVVGYHPDKPRIQLGPRIPLPVSQTTPVVAPVTVDMLQGSHPDRPRPFRSWTIGQWVAAPTDTGGGGFRAWFAVGSNIILGRGSS